MLEQFIGRKVKFIGTPEYAANLGLEFEKLYTISAIKFIDSNDCYNYCNEVNNCDNLEDYKDNLANLIGKKVYFVNGYGNGTIIIKNIFMCLKNMKIYFFQLIILN